MDILTPETQQDKNKDLVRLAVRVDRELAKRLKIQAIESQMTLEAFVSGLLEEALNGR